MEMKLIFAIIHNEDLEKLEYEFSESGIKSTKIASTGGFLKNKNTTIMIGIEAEKCDMVLGLINKYTNERKVKLDKGNMFGVEPVNMKGATVFVLDVDRFEQI
jgi:uncharacterized protein YaaQ